MVAPLAQSVVTELRLWSLSRQRPAQIQPAAALTAGDVGDCH
jgi:hypothetical protein